MFDNDPPERGLSDREAAALIGISRSLLRKIQSQDLSLPSMKIGGRRVYPRDKILIWRDTYGRYWPKRRQG